MKKIVTLSLLIISIFSTAFTSSSKIAKPVNSGKLVAGASWTVQNSRSSGTINSASVSVIYSTTLTWSNLGAGQTGSTGITGIRPEGATICVNLSSASGCIKIWGGSGSGYSLIYCFNVTSANINICIDQFPISPFNIIEWVDGSC
jgi:hypothetical protein